MSTPNCLICKLMVAMVPYVWAGISCAWLNGKYGEIEATDQQLLEGQNAAEQFLDKVISDLHRELHKLAKVEANRLGTNPSTAQRGGLQ